MFVAFYQIELRFFLDKCVFLLKVGGSPEHSGNRLVSWSVVKGVAIMF